MTELPTLLNVRLPEAGETLFCCQWQGSAFQATPMDRAQPPTGNTLDFQGDWLSPGGIDLQINGGLGLAFPEVTLATVDQLDAIAAYLWQQGVEGFCPTIVTTTPEQIQTALGAIATSPLLEPRSARAQILGVHLEGPFLNPAKRGAHPAAQLQALTLAHVQQVIGNYSDLVRIVTLAPEIATEPGIITWLRERQIVVSLGHSLATALEAEHAFEEGATMVTHAFNAMPPLHHREPGLLGAALARAGVRCGFIADGEHVCPTMLQLLLRLGQGTARLFLVSDALAPIGLPDGVYPWDTREITVTHGTARLPDGTLSGTTLPLLVGVENLVNWRLCEPGVAIALATQSPRLALAEETVPPPRLWLRWHQEAVTGQLHWQPLATPP